VVVAISVLAVAGIAGSATAANESKTLICHATGSGSYVLISVNANAVARFFDGHGSNKKRDLMPGPGGTCGGGSGGGQD
jgi:hypothetical protein